MTNPVVQSVLTGAIVSLALLVQSWAQERRRKIETRAAREALAEANAEAIIRRLEGQK